MGVTGLEPVTSSLSSNEPPPAGGAGKGLTSTPPAACTNACTSEAENANAGHLNADQPAQAESGGVKPDGQIDPLAVLAAAITTLSPTARARLAKMFQGE